MVIKSKSAQFRGFVVKSQLMWGKSLVVVV